MKKPEKEEKPLSGAQEAYEWLQILIVALVTIILVFTFVGRITPVVGESMLPTLHEGDVMLIRDIGYTDPQPGDIVVLTKEFDAARGPIVKRIIAVEGQTVDIDYQTGTVYVDGEALDEPYLNEPMEEPWYEDLTSVTVPEGSVFVMGDNRNHSNDSRDVTLGTVDTRYLLGKAEFICFPRLILSYFPNSRPRKDFFFFGCSAAPAGAALSSSSSSSLASKPRSMAFW